MEAAAPSTNADTNTEQALLMLDQPRVISILDGKHTYTFHFRRILQSDWENYFNGIYISSRNEKGVQHNVTDILTSAIALVESTLDKVEGYRRELTKADFTKIPPGHAIAISSILRNVSASDVEDDRPVDPELRDARIDAIWSKNASGADILYKGLLHTFAAPSVKQKQRFLRSRASSRIVGGAKNGMTVFSARNSALLKLYDELIQSTEGYGVQGRPLGGPDEIQREMDGLHKVEAVAQLFNTPDGITQAFETALEEIGAA